MPPPLSTSFSGKERSCYGGLGGKDLRLQGLVASSMTLVETH
jgi:hypothetical protein